MSKKNKYAALFEDADDVFLGSPKSKFLDIIFTANQNLVQDQLEKMTIKMAAMEILLEEKLGDYWERELATNDYERSAEVEEKTKSLYIEFTGEIVTRNE
ncbi:MAG: DUF2018 family protein [Sulfurimonadaceae bacterium]